MNLEEVPVNCSNHEADEMSELIIPLPEARTHFKQAKRSGVKQVFGINSVGKQANAILESPPISYANLIRTFAGTCGGTSGTRYIPHAIDLMQLQLQGGKII